MPQVFISYASQDTATAERICGSLEAAGMPCWIAPRDVSAGQPYAAAIVEAINRCRVMVLLLSSHAVASPHVLREVERASSKKRPIVSLRLDAAALPPELEYFLSANHWLDGSAGPVERVLPALVEAVRARLAAEAGAGSAAPAGPNATAPPGAGARGATSGRTALVAGIVVGVAVLGAVAYVASDRLGPHRTAAVSPAPDPSADKSIAVLPFVDMSEKHDQEYFSDGMTEEIIDLLVKVPGLKVPARTSSFYFKGKSTQVRDIAQQLGVANVLEGSIRRSGNHLRVTAQLVRADNGFHVWSETYDRQLDDVFKTQDEIAGAVVGALKMSLVRPEAPAATPTGSSDAYEQYLQGRALINRGSAQDLAEAYRKLRRAVDLDPKFALAWATLGQIAARDNLNWAVVFSSEGAAHGEDDLTGFEAAWAKARDASRAAAAEAVRLAPDLAATHIARAEVLELDQDWSGAERELARARELEPGNAGAYERAADVALTLGKVDESLALAQRAVELDPLGHAWAQVGFAYHAAGRLAEAAQAFRRGADLYPTALMTHFRYASVLLAQGDADGAMAEYQRESLFGARELGVALALDALGRHAEAAQRMADIEAHWGNGLAYQIAYFYSGRGDADRAFAWLERAYRQHDGGMVGLKCETRFANLRRDPRFTQLLRRMNLPTDPGPT